MNTIIHPGIIPITRCDRGGYRTMLGRNAGSGAHMLRIKSSTTGGKPRAAGDVDGTHQAGPRRGTSVGVDAPRCADAVQRDTRHHVPLLEWVAAHGAAQACHV